MPRFTLSQMLVAIGYIAIALLFSQSEGCGSSHAKVESLAFSADNSRILVSKLNARLETITGKSFPADISRTVSWIDARGGGTFGIVQQDVSRGLNFSVLPLWRHLRRSTVCYGPDDRVAILELVSGQLTREIGSETPQVDSAVLGTTLAVSKSGQHLAICGLGEMFVLDTINNRIAMRVPLEPPPFSRGAKMSFLADEGHIMVEGGESVGIWDIATSSEVSKVADFSAYDINSIAVAPDDTMIACSRDWIRRYSVSGNLRVELSNRGGDPCIVSEEGRLLAVCGYDGLALFDLTSNQLLRRFQVAKTPTCLALSADGSKLLVGDRVGCVQMFDTKSGKRLWYAYPPGRYRLPWTTPLTFLIVWSLAIWRFSKRSPKKDAP